MISNFYTAYMMIRYSSGHCRRTLNTVDEYTWCIMITYVLVSVECGYIIAKRN